MKNLNGLSITIINKLKIILLFIIGSFFCVQSYGQEPSHTIQLVFVDSLGNIITPNLEIRSKTIHLDSIKVVETQWHTFNVDSASIYTFDRIRIFQKTYEIFPFIGNHWLDTEYDIKIMHEKNEMHLNLLTLGFTIKDTIVFRPGRYFLIRKDLLPEKMQLLEPLQEKCVIVSADVSDTANLSSINEKFEISELDADFQQLLNMRPYIPETLKVNQIPVGIVINRDTNLYVCYFSKEFTYVLMKYYFPNEFKK